MNAARRKAIEKAVAKIEEAKAILEEAHSEEEDYYDLMPENLQGSERGQKSEDAFISLQEALDACDEAIECSNHAIEE